MLLKHNFLPMIRDKKGSFFIYFSQDYIEAYIKITKDRYLHVSSEGLRMGVTVFSAIGEPSIGKTGEYSILEQ